MSGILFVKLTMKYTDLLGESGSSSLEVNILNVDVNVA